ncbi:MAG: Uncharacterised protein [Marine Group II euryarchaeote MED-G33]|nr:MAG: Uncharacterised protein [Marine Group II euryarchaeote MED-G33]
MQTTGINTKSLADDENADARINSFFTISAILTAVLIIVWTLAPPADIGVDEGQLAPNIVSEAHVNGNWEDFRLYDYINHTWTQGEQGTFIFLQFADTDCGHCWSDAAQMTALHSQFGIGGSSSLDDVEFITISVGMLDTDHSRAETVAFQEKGDWDGCNRNSNCASRGGEVHNWPYVDDLNLRAFNDYNPPGVPFHLMLSPDGIVVWNSALHKDVSDPLYDPGVAIEYHLTESA